MISASTKFLAHPNEINPTRRRSVFEFITAFHDNSEEPGVDNNIKGQAFCIDG
jgi:hypothetical protein